MEDEDVSDSETGDDSEDGDAGGGGAGGSESRCMFPFLPLCVRAADNPYLQPPVPFDPNEDYTPAADLFQEIYKADVMDYKNRPNYFDMSSSVVDAKKMKENKLL
jgi:hypothetical protein